MAQDQLGIAHEGATADDAWQMYSGRGDATGTPRLGDLVFFGPGPVNGNAGHVGIATSSGAFRSVLSDGNVYVAPIAQFAQDNGVPVLG